MAGETFIRASAVSTLFLFCAISTICAHAEGVDSFSSVLKLIQDQKISSTDALIAQLPKSMRSRYSLVYGSRNTAQFADKAQPRVLLFSKDSKLVIAVSGARDQAGFNSVEAIEFNSEQKKFQFHSIQFGEKNQVTINRDADSCMSCHRGKPIWDEYDQWPGIYGSSAKAPAQEESLYKNFVQQMKDKPIYNKLVGLSHRERIANFTQGGIRDDLEAFNRDVTESLADLNFQKILNEIKNNSQYRSHRAALLAAASDDPKFLDYLPDTQSRKERTAAWRKSEKDSRTFQERYYQRRAQRTEQLLGERIDERSDHWISLDEEWSQASKVKFVMNEMGMDLSQYSMSLERNTLSFTTPQYGFMKLRTLLWQDARQDYPYLSKYLPFSANAGGNGYADKYNMDRAIEQLPKIKKSDLEPKGCGLKSIF